MRLETVFVANRVIPLPAIPSLRMVVVTESEGAADAYLRENVDEGDLAISRDIPLAADLVERGVVVLDNRGDTFTKENVRERLSLRNFMSDLRLGGVQTERNRPLGSRDIAAFANALDRQLAKIGTK